MAAVLLGRRRGAEDRDHVVGDVRRRGPDLGAVDQKAAVGLGRLGLGREQVGAGIRLAHADRKADFAAADARQDVHLDVLGRVFQQHRAALPVGDEEAPCRRVGDAHFLGHHIAFEKGTFVPAIFLRPGHAEPAARADPAGKFRRVGVFAVGLVRIERAGGDFLGEERAHFLAQLLAFRRQADRIETKGCGHVEPVPNTEAFLRIRVRYCVNGGELPLPLWERVGVRGSGLSMERNPSPGSHLSMRSDLSHKGRGSSECATSKVYSSRRHQRP